VFALAEAGFEVRDRPREPEWLLLFIPIALGLD
jgi:hypothetical protein